MSYRHRSQKFFEVRADDGRTYEMSIMVSERIIDLFLILRSQFQAPFVPPFDYLALRRSHIVNGVNFIRTLTHFGWDFFAVLRSSRKVLRILLDAQTAAHCVKLCNILCSVTVAVTRVVRCTVINNYI